MDGSSQVQEVHFLKYKLRLTTINTLLKNTRYNKYNLIYKESLCQQAKFFQIHSMN